tara:strand:+ start:2224 stop:2649 length:426 start_codon:yes stop_codon:yes gene_type:complete
MNTNKIKKISVKFPNFVSKDNIEYEGKRIVLKLPQIQDINNRMYSELFSGDSGMQVGARNLPRIEGFNCTWRNDEKNPQFTIAQFTMASGEEKKVMRIVEKYGGKVIPSRQDLNQWAFDETNLSGKVTQVENVHETLGKLQ